MQARLACNARRIFRRASLCTAALGLLHALTACDPGTRIEGKITLASGQEAPDDNRHTLYIAAYGSSAVIGGILNTAATPVWVEFGGIENADFDPDVTYALGGAGSAEEVHVYAWWKTGLGEQNDYKVVTPGDRFGKFPGNPIFIGQHGNGGGAHARDVDIVLDSPFVSGSSAIIVGP